MIAAEARGAWEELLAQLRPFVAHRVPAPADVDDVVQDVFLRLQRSLPTLRDERRFGPWVYRVARSAIADHRRTRARHPLTSDGDVDIDLLAAAVSESHADDDAAAQVCRALAPFVARLPSPYREAITLTELEGLSQKAAAAMLGVSLSGMKSSVQRGRDRLRQMLLACCQIALDARGRVVDCSPRAGSGCRCG